MTARQVVFTLGDARSFSGLTSKIPPLDAILNFDTDVKRKTACHQCENGFTQYETGLKEQGLTRH